MRFQKLMFTTLFNLRSNQLSDAYFDAVIVAQALHWFDLDQFWVEVNRVLQAVVFLPPGAILFCISKLMLW